MTMGDEDKKKTRRILLVEDTATLARMYEQYLIKQGHEVIAVITARDALDYISRHDIDLMLLDLKLPDMDGLELMEELTTLDFSAPIVIITGHGSINTAVEAMRLGAWDFLVKPFNVDRLGEAVDKALVSGSFGANENAANFPGMQQGQDVHLAAGIGDSEGEVLAHPHEAQVLNADRQLREPIEKPGNDQQPITTVPRLKDKSKDPDFGGFIGTSAVMQSLYKQLENAARSQAPVFITGESGTGKEVCAEAIHKYSARADKPFIPINCAAIPRDLIESELFGHVKGAFTGAIYDRDGAAKLANGGTLFLDEIGEMDVNMQTKLLRFLQNYTFQKVGGSRLERTDVRIVCATNRNPQEEIQKGNFREDLFYRLHVIPVHMPPLSRRGDDVIDIAHALLRKYAREENKAFRQFSEEAELILHRHSWPGNIRELQNIVRNIVVMNSGDMVTAQMLPAHLLVPPAPHQPQAQYEPHSSRASSGIVPEPTVQSALLPPVNVGGLSNSAADLSQLAGDGAGTSEHRSVDDVVSLSPYGASASLSGTAGHGIKPLWLSEKEAIENAIHYCGGNIPKAAALLEVSPSTIYRKKSQWEENASNTDTHS